MESTLQKSWTERLVVVMSFILIFAFNSIDNAIAPLVTPISQTFGVSAEHALWFISFCAGGTVVGLIFGPSILQSMTARKCLAYTLIALAGGQAIFALTGNFTVGLAGRLLSGLGAGLVASCMWQLTFHGVSKAYFPAMIAVLMSARPLAVALGVPLAGMLAWKVNWQLPIWTITALTALSGALLCLMYPRQAARDAVAPQDEAHSSQKKEQNSADQTVPSNASSSPSLISRVITPYIKALKVPYAWPYYLGSTVNRMAYFGFYSFCGLWFKAHYGLNIKDISYALLIIGLAEALVNFTTNRIIALCGHKTTFLTSLILSGCLLPVFIFGGLGVKCAVGLIAAFMLLDRVYSMALVISVPKMFPTKGDMTAFGSLNTLTAWGAMCLVSWIQGLIGNLGIGCLEAMILACFYLGSAGLVYIQARTVFQTNHSQNESQT